VFRKIGQKVRGILFWAERRSKFSQTSGNGGSDEGQLVGKVSLNGLKMEKVLRDSVKQFPATLSLTTIHCLTGPKIYFPDSATTA